MNRHDRDLKDLLMAVSEGEVGPGLAAMAAEQYQRIFGKKRRLSKPAPTSSAHHDAEREKKRQGRRERVAAIREQVMARAGGRCEAWIPRLSASENLKGERCTGPAVIMDHWLGGSGRRRAMESVWTFWAICLAHNDERTANHPGAWWWNHSFEMHCTFHGYPFTPHYDARAASRAAPEREDGR